MHSPDAHVGQAVAHLPGGAGGKGHREHAVRADEAVVHQVGDAVGNRAGLAGARARQDAHWAARGGRGDALILVEIAQVQRELR